MLPANAPLREKFSPPKCMGALASLAVFAVFVANLQRETSHWWRKSWAADGLTSERTARRPLFFRCFKPRSDATAGNNFAMFEEFRKIVDITIRINFINTVVAWAPGSLCRRNQ